MSGVDQHGYLEEEQPFSYRKTKDGKVFISHEGKQIKVLKGKQAEKLLENLEHGDALDIQLALAKITGNFKRGNEREGKSR
jgi:hypothetical protein